MRYETHLRCACYTRFLFNVTANPELYTLSLHDALPLYEARMCLADHLTHLVDYGMLHLLGHDHENEAEAARMERLESQVLASLGISGRRPERGTEF